MLLAPGERGHGRRKLFDLVRVLGGGRDAAAHLAAELSDELRRSHARGETVRVRVTLDPRATGATLRLELKTTEGERHRASHLALFLRGAELGEPRLARLRGVLKGQSREELFASLEASNRALERSRAAAEHAGAAKATFLANMSHEIRTPMNAIVGMNRMALATELAPRQRSYLEKIDASARHLLGILDDILDVSKVEAGKLNLERGEVSITRLLDDVTALAGHACNEKGLAWQVTVADDVPGRVRGDALRLRQVLVNLVSNAVKFTDAGSVTLRVEHLVSDNAEVALRFSVRDSGIGISHANQQRLFQAFAQADTSITRRYGGTGLGLAISQRLVGLMGGELTVKSEPGSGATFAFNARFEPSVVAPIAPTLASQLRGRRALVADADAAPRAVTRELLVAMGFEVEEVASSHAAMERVGVVEFSLIIVAEELSESDGIETARQLRTLAAMCSPGLFLTCAYGRGEAARHHGSDVLDGVFEQPLDATHFAEVVAAHLSVAGERTPSEERGNAPRQRTFAPDTRVLLVEDNPINREVASEMLTSWGLTIDVAHHGAEALARLAVGPPIALVLMDVQMPVMDGLQATRALRRDPQHALLPILAMTANALPADHQAYLAVGMNDVITKPVDPDALLAAIGRYLPPMAWSSPKPTTTLPTLPTAPLNLDTPLLDVARGLRFTRNQPALYERLLRGFLDDQRRLPEELTAALAEGDPEGLARAAHTLRGLASGLGASPLSLAAERLEERIRQRETPPSQHDLAELTRRLADEHRALYAALEETGG
jgi:signal transduction histidine kinase